MKSFQSPLLFDLADDNLRGQALLVNRLFSECLQSKLSAAIELGNTVKTLKEGEHSKVVQLYKILLVVNVEAAAFIKSILIDLDTATSEAQEMQNLFGAAQTGDLEAYAKLVEVGRKLGASTGDELQPFLELGIVEPDALQFLMELSGVLNAGFEENKI